VDSRTEIRRKGYMEGKYITGVGKASSRCRQHISVFNCNMFGTFNVRLKHGNILDFTPTVVSEKNNYWLVKLRRSKVVRYGWAVRGKKSRQKENTLEVLTKVLLPESLKEERFAVNVFERWKEGKILEWVKDKYWFQGFDFSPVEKADSLSVWKKLNFIDWSNLSVLDLGCHYGYFSFNMSAEGAHVVGVEPDVNSRRMSQIIQENIIMQDVDFVRDDDKREYDIIVYLSVHHQIDPTYQNLKEMIDRLKRRSRNFLFVELIMPPMFPKGNTLSEREIDNIVGGRVLDKYQHNVRGVRKIYVCDDVGKGDR